MKRDGKTIWITGASSGIGRQAATDLAQKGCVLLVSSRNVDTLKTTQEECLKSTSKVEILALDLEQIERLQQKTEEALSLFKKSKRLICRHFQRDGKIRITFSFGLLRSQTCPTRFF